MALLHDDEIDRALADRPHWRRAGAELVLERTVADFAAAIAYVNRVAEVAEARDHHPDLEVHGWNTVRLRVSTHSEGGITAADLALVAAIDELG
ncbi:4a-hydroxytetrahydrobiopterin dehydratase [Conexibacter sp. W3-3-2]|uniref:Putative pterin-4-alpha-carbinolamine dehydratase n=1 Tax=Paraconexibacter algicola TaxID=2133960 RepID=A0A2T4UFD6_9ACTN|nr:MULTISPECIES: 4a-hydroxytetrahydrobiopterin dehydratase [Solirubrobacterales]MTD46951.1 4a-hydroxytetrahydrobiopterin dehydratase [Conexibacter sp. W3-3-2]PTL56480.1 4a-hydroxytetrahydrobiopterin dehydratase [Paraconexibacter algicola]